jgi:5-methyltetrahydrofolate--homocysteine methyltransferase
MAHPYLDAARERVVVFDGATGTNLQLADLGPDDFGGMALEGCNEILVRTRPDVIRQLHASFLEVGVDCIETDSFGSSSVVLAEYGLAADAHALNVEAAALARELADSYATPGRPRWVAGSIGPTTKLPTLGHITYREMRDSIEEQAHGLLEGGVDLLVIETQQDLLCVKAAMNGCRRAMRSLGLQVPLQVQVTIETNGRMLVGSEIGAALVSIDAMRADVIGLNCATGPGEMTEHLRHLQANSRVPISCLPNAGLPSIVDGRTHYDLTPDDLAEHHARFITEVGVSVVGGCCGTTPEHLRAVLDRCAQLTPRPRDPHPEPSATSVYSPVPYDQDVSVLLIGERTNTNGSRAFRDALLEGRWDDVVRVGTDQVKESAHLVDVCVDYVGRDGTRDMDEVASRYATAVPLPLVLDSTEPQVLEAGLERLGGKCLLNSANLEDGEHEGSRFDRVMSLAREHGAGVICLTIDEEGQARTRERKLAIARRIRDLATERYGVPAEDLFFDCLALTLGTGLEESYGDGVETIEAIRMVKAELPGVHTVLGLSNVSFGLSPGLRHYVNSVFLHECQQAGLDAAILHAGKILPMAKIPERARQLCLDLVWNRRTPDHEPLGLLLNEFSDAKGASSGEREDRSGWPVEQRLEQRIIDGDRTGLADELDEALAGGLPALSIVNDVLLAGMRTVGELFGSGQMQLPFVLQSAETMKMAVDHLKPHMPKVEGQTSKGRIVLATVKGDVHDIGKNLVDIILTNNGYEVHNIGIKVPLSSIIEKAREVKADALGMSGLLVKSTLVMRDNLLELNELGAAVPVLLGGAALTRRYVERDLREVYEGRLFYGKDAFEGLRTMDRLMSIERGTEPDDGDWGREPVGREVAAAEPAAAPAVPKPRRSPSVALDNPVPRPPFLGSRVARGIALDEIAGWVNETALFRTQWGFRPEKASGESDEDMRVRVRGTFRQQLAAAKAAGVLVPQVVYGYFPVNGDGDDLIVWEDEARTVERCRFAFPRQPAEPFLSIADMFRPVESGEGDVAAFSIVTMGGEVTEAAARLKAEDRYSDYVFLHGLGVEMTEALAELWHHRIREELGIASEDGTLPQVLHKQGYRGGRYSWGYPACPDLEDNVKVAHLLGADRIGLEVSEETGYQFHPEYSTSAVICHHPQAKYFVT